MLTGEWLSSRQTVGVLQSNQILEDCKQKGGSLNCGKTAMTLDGDKGPETLEGSPVAADVVTQWNFQQRTKPMIHSAVDPPLCEKCQELDLSFFDPGCPGCLQILQSTSTSIADIFAIIRQWTAQTQQNIELLTREILKRGANVDDRDGLTDMTLLHYVSKAGTRGMADLDTVCRLASMLIDIGANVYIRCRWTNMTALHYAAYFNVVPVMELLLKASQGLDVDSRCSEFDNGSTLHITCTNLAYEASQCLLTAGADPQTKDDLGRTPLECIPKEDEYPDIPDVAALVNKLKTLLTEAGSVNRKQTPANYDNVSGKVTLQALGVQLGEKVMVGGIKGGTLRYCGPTEFATGIWAGIELDEPEGKNDGSVAGFTYFTCSPKHGIFAPISKISKPGNCASGYTTPSKGPINRGKIEVSHVMAKVDTGLRSGRSRTPTLDGAKEFEMGDRVIVAGHRKGVIKFAGETKFAPGRWYGIELDKAVGKNDGTVNGERYFTCRPKCGVFAPASRIQRIGLGRSSSVESIDSIQGDLADKLSGSLTSVASAGRSRTPVSSGRLTPVTKRSSSASGRSNTVMKRRSVSHKRAVANEDLRLTEGMNVFCSGELGVVRYIGQVDFAGGVWLGVELRTPKGKNDGSVQGRRYFTCKPDHGLIVRPIKVTVRGINGAKLLGDTSQYLKKEESD